MTINIIAAVAQNNAIGYNNKLIYWLPNDLKRFKALTTGNTIIMGRRTFESLPKGALPNRRNIVLSRNGRAEDFPGCELYASLDDALAQCHEHEDIYIIGGNSVYKSSMPLADRLCLTLVHDTPNPVVQTTAHAPDGPLPTRPTRIGSKIAWEKDVPGLLDIASGVTGPLILTPEGLTAVNPADGSTLWSYHRTGAQYVSLREGMWYNMFGPGRYRSYLLTNPNGRYVAFRIDAPDGLEQGGKEIRFGVLTIIIDTATGQVTSEHRRVFDSSAHRHRFLGRQDGLQSL